MPGRRGRENVRDHSQVAISRRISDQGGAEFIGFQELAHWGKLYSVSLYAAVFYSDLGVIPTEFDFATEGIRFRSASLMVQ